MKLVVPTTGFPRYEGDYAGHFILSLLRVECALRPDLEAVVVRPDAPLSGEAPLQLPAGVSVAPFLYLSDARRQTLVYGSGIVPNVRANPFRLWQLPFLMRGFKRATADAARDAALVHAHWSFAGLCSLRAVRERIPVVVTLHGSDFSGAGGRLVDAMTRSVIRRATGIVCVNDRLRRRVVESGVDPRRVVTIRNGIDVERLRPRRDRSALAQTVLSEAEEIILFLGRLEHVKGPDRALDVFETLIEKHPRAGLLMVGDGSLERELKARAAATPGLAGRVHWAGAQPMEKISGFFAAADALLVSSRNEGLPTTVLESLAAGVPVVTVPVGGVPEVVRDGETGFCTGENTVAALAAALERCFSGDDLRKRVVAGGRAFVESELTWEQTARRHLEFYERAIRTSAKLERAEPMEKAE